MIERRHYPDLDLIVHRVVGELDVEAFRDAGEALYAMEPVPKLSLWDLREASLTQFTVARIRSVQADLGGRVRGREEGRTAVVVAEDFEYGVSRQYTAYSEGLDLPFQQESFRSLDEALEWLGVDKGRLEEGSKGS
ncbi:MAG: hypothetical protein R3253_08080 [Longimicrobiales bacterium]|nr:hypothetical protein [Longimicrobiales bacterium]